MLNSGQHSKAVTLDKIKDKKNILISLSLSQLFEIMIKLVGQAGNQFFYTGRYLDDVGCLVVCDFSFEIGAACLVHRNQILILLPIKV